MKAKDTVMSYESIEQMLHTTKAELVDKGRNIAEAQAEISFKAGREQEHKAMIGVAVDGGNKTFKDGKQVGIKEVVEWVWGNRFRDDYGHDYLWLEDGWEAKLKEWEAL